jgi:hypothetical protein
MNDKDAAFLFDLLNNNDHITIKEEDLIKLETLISKEEFTQLKQLQSSVDETMSSKKLAIEQQLLAKLPKPQQPKIPIWKISIPAWQAAAVLMISGVVFMMGVLKEQEQSSITSIEKDTIWLEKRIETKVFDTVFLENKLTQNYGGTSKNTAKVAPSKEISEKGDIYIEGLGGINDYHNQLNGISLKDDSIPINLGFVRL